MSVDEEKGKEVKALCTVRMCNTYTGTVEG
jgi:hypothetical protein